MRPPRYKPSYLNWFNVLCTSDLHSIPQRYIEANHRVIVHLNTLRLRHPHIPTNCNILADKRNIRQWQSDYRCAIANNTVRANRGAIDKCRCANCDIRPDGALCHRYIAANLAVASDLELRVIQANSSSCTAYSIWTFALARPTVDCSQGHKVSQCHETFDVGQIADTAAAATCSQKRPNARMRVRAFDIRCVACAMQLQQNQWRIVYKIDFQIARLHRDIWLMGFHYRIESEQNAR